MNPVKAYKEDALIYIVAVCAFCGRWRDSLYQWIEPPKIVDPLVDEQIIQLSHTYCGDCLLEQSKRNDMDTRQRELYAKMAERERLRSIELEGNDYEPGDIVHNAVNGLLPA